MNNADFNAYKSDFRAVIRKILAETEQGRLNEAGFPAYSHQNPLINWLFWKRLHKVINYTERFSPYNRTLDFGCGSGVMLPFLCGISQSVTALDLDLLPLERVQRYRPFPPNLTVHDARKKTLQDLPIGSFDLILALDVLEHVQDLPTTLLQLLKLLSPDGQIVISGPTENALYKLGRALAGPEYSGDYHERGILEVRKQLQFQARVLPIAKLYWPLSLFEIFAVRA